MLSATPNVIMLNVISSEYSMRLELHSVYDQDYFGVQIIENVVFFSIFASATPIKELRLITLLAWNN